MPDMAQGVFWWQRPSWHQEYDRRCRQVICHFHHDRSRLNISTPMILDLQPRDVFRELLQETQLPSDELSAVFDELLALKEEKALR